MKNTVLLSLITITTFFSCVTPELCHTYTDYYSKKFEKNDYCHDSKVDRKRKKIFKKYLENLKKPNTSLITIEYLNLNPDLLGYSVYFINTSDKSYTVAYYKSINHNKVKLEKKCFEDGEDLRLVNENFFVRYVWENGINFNLNYFKNNVDYMLDMHFGKTIITEYDKNLKVKNSKLFDSRIYLANLKYNVDN